MKLFISMLLFACAYITGMQTIAQPVPQSENIQWECIDWKQCFKIKCAVSKEVLLQYLNTHLKQNTPYGAIMKIYYPDKLQWVVSMNPDTPNEYLYESLCKAVFIFAVLLQDYAMVELMLTEFPELDLANQNIFIIGGSPPSYNSAYDKASPVYGKALTYANKIPNNNALCALLLAHTVYK